MPLSAVRKQNVGGGSTHQLRRRRKAPRGKDLLNSGDVVVPIKQLLMPGLEDIDVSFSSSSFDGSGGDANLSCKIDDATKVTRQVVSEDDDDTRNDEDASVSSIDSLLSANSEDEDYSSISQASGHRPDKTLRGLERLEKRLERRRRKLHMLCAGKSEAYACLLKSNEAEVRQLKMKRFLTKRAQKKRSRGRPSGKSKNITFSPSIEEQPTKTHTLLLMLWWVLFEFHHTIPASLKLVVICLCHLFFHGTIETASKVLYHNVFFNVMSQQVHALCQVVLGLCLLRANGYVWYFLDNHAYNIVKFDMHNRLHLGHLDAKLLSFCKSSVYGSAANLIGFYLVYVGLNQVIITPFNVINNNMEAWYLITKETALEKHDFDKSALKFYSWEGTSPGYSEEEHKTCELLKQYIHPPSLQWLFEYCCKDPSQEWKAVEIAYYGVGLLAMTISAASFGVNLLEICDEE
jgi:hypothetical protein